MKNLLFLLALISTTLLTSCSKEDNSEAKVNCAHLEGQLQVRPFCSFAPANFPDQPFPIAVWYQGAPIHLENFSFQWNNGVTASAISVTHNALPITVEITEESTGCLVEIVFSTEYWE